ncbi:acetamidase/formamidase family protein [Alkalihalobacillus sp. MEB130]|uniref:acetamidase/formamidase family protein n=1 Tax=Alkalihalobacillus sp. MEB130 TaxID=2976704 RepID=UPI0028DE7E90|nr:acetamidase/formamidase family protein [Alkalihalobacillus sp. MEB130]MDT8861570.1 acetamidase/formamidase family protein [Alkalihalobacillus sp. MEB130]
MRHVIKANDETLHGSFSKDYQPILTVQSGDSIQYSTVDIGWGYNDKNGNRKEYSSREREEMWGHPIVGPVSIEHAKPGHVLEVKINDIVPSWYGWNCAAGKSNWHNDQLQLSNSEQIRFDWTIDNDKQIATAKRGHREFSVPIRPFMGVLATAPKESGIHSTIPPRYCGGNIDCKELTKGSTLYLPISVRGALFSIGDGHAAQGDGEVSGQAIECPMDLVDVTLTIREDMQLAMPYANTSSAWITFGFDEDLNKATIAALNGMISVIQHRYAVSKSEATALASVVVDLRITQIVNQVKGVHAILPHGALR